MAAPGRGPSSGHDSQFAVILSVLPLTSDPENLPWFVANTVAIPTPFVFLAVGRA